MGAGIAEVFARTGYAVVGVEKDDGRAGPRPAVPRALDRPRGEAREADRGRAGRAARPDHVHAPRWRTSPTPTSWSRPSSSRWRPRRRSSASSTRSSAPDTILATNTSSLSVTEISTANSSPGRVIGVHFFNPAPVQQLVEIVRTVVTEEQVLERRQGADEPSSARPRSSAATRPASSPTPCSSATSTTRSRCTRAATPPARTSTPRCASAAATRWARWRCST